MKHSRFLRSVAVLSLGGFLAKAIGALYRVPLAGLLGGYGMGLYQMAYPLFCLFLTFSSAGIPSAFSRMVAEERARGKDCGRLLRAALGTFSLLGLAGAAAMAALAPAVARVQGEPALVPCYLALSPAVFLVALIAVFRGYFQGMNAMMPTAVSELVEQLFKAGAGLFFAARIDRPELAAVGALAAVTLSEAAALLLLAVRRDGGPAPRFLPVGRRSGAEVLAAAFPVMVSAGLLPLSQMADSVVIVRLLARHTADAVALYGLFAGAAATLVRLPATVCYGLAAATVPAVSGRIAVGDFRGGRERAMYALLLTVALSAPCAAALFLFAGRAVALLYPGMPPAEAETLVSLVRLLSVSAVALAGVDTLSACLTGMGRAKRAAFSMLVAVLVKLALQFALVSDPVLSVGGAAIAANACYLVAFSLDLFYTVRSEKQTGEREHDYDHRAGNGEGRREPAGDGGDRQSGSGARAGRHAARGGEPA